MSNYGYDPSALIGIYLAYFAFAIIFYVWFALALSKVFAKLGVEGWKAWVPILNIITLFQLGGVNPMKILFNLIPFVGPIIGLVFQIIAVNGVNKRFGQGTGMTVLYVFLPAVWASILGFGSAVPIGGVPASAGAAPAYGAPPAPAVSAPPVPPASPAPAWSSAATITPPPAAVAPAAPAPPAPPAPPAAVSAPPAPPALVEPPVISPPPAAPSTPVTNANPWAPPITGVPGLEVTPPVVVPPVADPIPTPVTNSVNTSAQVAELQPTIEEENPDFDKTVVAPRKKKESWTITPEGSTPITLTKSAALLGRNPSSTAADTQLISVPDPSKTVSKTHARLTLADGVWTIVDLNSTNGVYLLTAAGEESEVEAGVPTTIGDSFRLGDLTIRISKD